MLITTVWRGTEIDTKYDDIKAHADSSLGMVLRFFKNTRVDDDPPAVLNGNSISFEAAALKKVEDRCLGDVWMRIHALPFCRVWLRQKAIVRALSTSDGPWSDEKRIKDGARATVDFREHLNTTLDNLEDLAQAIEWVHSGMSPGVSLP